MPTTREASYARPPMSDRQMLRQERGLSRLRRGAARWVVLGWAGAGALLPACRRTPTERSAPPSVTSSVAAVVSRAPAAPAAASSAAHAWPTYRLVARVKAANGGPNDAFGAAIAVDDDTLAVGAPGRKDAIGRGVVYVFRRDGETWTQEAVVRNPKNDAASGDTVALVRSRLFVSRSDPYRTEAPAWFRRDEGRWVADGYEPVPRGSSVGFGALISVSGDRVLISSRGEYGGAGTYFAYDATATGLRATDAIGCFKDCETNYYPEGIATNGSLMVAVARLSGGPLHVAIARDGKMEGALRRDWARVAVCEQTVVLSDERGTDFVEKRDGAWGVVQHLEPSGAVMAHGDLVVSGAGLVFGTREADWQVVGRLEGLEKGRGSVAAGGKFVAVQRGATVVVFERVGG